MALLVQKVSMATKYEGGGYGLSGRATFCGFLKQHFGSVSVSGVVMSSNQLYREKKTLSGSNWCWMDFRQDEIILQKHKSMKVIKI